MYKNIHRLFILALINTAVLSLAFADGIGDLTSLSPFWRWKTIETEHFRITFPEELADTTNKTATYFEEAHKILSPALHWNPNSRVQVLVIDNSDAANGLTSAVLRLGIVLMVTPPDNWFSTAYYDDWLWLLVVHEYTHFLNMDATSSFYNPLRYILGDVILPNSFWPPWMLEGLAVYMETRWTKAGRGRSPHYDMVIRAAVEQGVLDSDEFITLDKVNGPNPYYPGGETPYLFGYHLMDTLSAYKHDGMTHDRSSSLSSGDDVLGVMSKRSSGRIPFFINGNIENITGKPWQAYWEEWVTNARKRANMQLKQIKSQPVSKYKKITENGYDILGSAVSPDGQWLAYSMDSYKNPMSLYLRNNQTGETRRICEKLLGTTISFTPDSNALVFSMLKRSSNYNIFSDIYIYDIKSESLVSLTEGARFRDPDISPYGRKLVFTFTENSTTGLGTATLVTSNGKYSLDSIERTYMPQKYGRVSTPKFTGNKDSVVFSQHINGQASEEIMGINLKTKVVKTLVKDGNFNRFPAIDHDGFIYYVSNATGVDNLYLYAPDGPVLVTNVTTGIAFPTFSKKDKTLYVSVFSSDGWNLATIEPNEGLSREKATITTTTPEASPKYDINDVSSNKTYEVKDYSVIPSIWPRQWLPWLSVDSGNFYAAFQALGFDAVDRHRYILGLGYDSQIKKPDWLAYYANRSLGPTISVTGANRTSVISITGSTGDIEYIRKTELATSISFPFRWTFSQLTPSLSFQAEQSAGYISGPNYTEDSVTGKSRYVPSMDALLEYSGTRGSRLGITAEQGRLSKIGTRRYLGPDGSTWKMLISDTEFIKISQHSVLVPSVKSSYVSHINESYLPENVVVQGRLDKLTGGLSDDSFDQLSIRGYPLMTFFARSAHALALDYRFPIVRIFRGTGTHPIFLENFYGFAFCESTFFPGSKSITVLSSAGSGLKLSTRFLIHVPVNFSLEYHHGFNKDLGGRGETFLQVSLDGFNF